MSFESIAESRGWITREQIQEALLVQALELQQRNRHVPLAKILVETGTLTPAQIEEIERERRDQLAHAAERELPGEVRKAMEKPDSRVDKFVRLELVGRGGVGDVWRAYDLMLGREVAIKFLRRGDPELARRMAAEARILAKLQHPNIVPIYEVGPDYLVMPFIAGRTLDRIEAPLDETLNLVRTVAMTVGFAHEQGIVHRDLKPQNIIVGDNGTPYLTDFGVAKQMDLVESVSVTGTVIGTPAYMPPEQVRGRVREIDARSDVYSLGATLYAALVGRPPFVSEDLYDLLTKIQQATPAPPSALNRRVPRSLDAVILKALEKRPQDRYASAQTFADDLERVRRGEAPSVRPAGPVRRLLRSKTLAVAVVLAVSAIGALMIANRLKTDPSPVPQIRQKLDANAHIELGISHAKEGRKQQAIEAFTRALELDPKNALAYYQRALVHLQMNRRDEALRDLDNCLKYADAFGQDLVEKVRQVRLK